MTENVVREAGRVQELITREADYLTVRQLDQVSDKLREIREIIRHGGNPYPGPGPVPPQYPPQEPPHYGNVSVRGDIEGTAFSFDVRDLQNLHEQCVAFTSSKGLTTVDDIRVSVNLATIRTLKNSASYWRGANQICSQIVEVAKQSGVRVSYTNHQVVFGSIEGTEFNFKGFGKSDMFRQCESFTTSKGLTTVDDIVRITNFGPERVLKNSASYWRGALEICQQVLAEVP
jgi:hypothetical protein